MQKYAYASTGRYLQKNHVAIKKKVYGQIVLEVLGTKRETD